MTRVFVDGAAGTTGLEIVDRLRDRREFALHVLNDAARKDDGARRAALNDCDVAILCLPDDAARAAVAMIDAPDVRVIDASSAFRTAPDWTYGFPELGHDVAHARRVSNPGCYPTGFLAIVVPLVHAGLVPADWAFSVNAVSGYSGGGNALIGRYRDAPALAHRVYGFGAVHKHVAEMQVRAGLAHPPVFAPSVTHAYRGMIVDVPLPLAAMPGAPPPAAALDALRQFYAGSPIVRVAGAPGDELLMEAARDPGDAMMLYVADYPNGMARGLAVLDNLGKGASGAAVQSLNLMCGLPETTGLRL